MHRLDSNEQARAYFLRSGPAVQAGYRAALRDMGVALPSWAQPKRAGRPKADKSLEPITVITKPKSLESITVNSTESIQVNTLQAATDPLTGLPIELRPENSEQLREQIRAMQVQKSAR
jgi:hypothetical protein